MAERLKQMKERSKMRRQLLAQQLGVSNQDDFSMILGKKEKLENDSTAAKKSNDFSTDAPKSFTSVKDANKDGNSDLNDPSKDESNSSIYTDSKTFLKGTHSLNPHNDYCQHFVDTLHRPHNFIRDTGIADRFEEYPKLKELIKLKDQIIAERATPPMYLRCDLEEFPLTDLNYEFDVIVIDPPLEEYQRRCPGLMFNWNPWQWDEIIRLEIGQIAAQRSFCFLWCGAAEGLNEGRKCLKQWGFRRCEDICWIKTNKTNPGNTKYMEPNSVLQHTKEHCLMGIKGTVRRSTDGDFIHANVDLDIIISEEPEYGSTDKPEEIFRIVEHFCLGRRRLHVFGNDHTIRPGWVTIGPSLTSSNYSAEQYHSFFGDSPEGATVGSTELIEQLRPKSPPLKIKNQSSGRGRGRGDGDINQGRGQSFGRGSGQRTNFNQRPFISKIGFQN